ncbi:MAG: M14 family zinc carboxypeptidase [Bacteroidales bacterium]
MKRSLFAAPLLIAIVIFSGCREKKSPQIELKYDQNISLTYDEVIKAYNELDRYYPEAKLIEVGNTDIGKSLHLFMISSEGDFNPESIHAKGKCILMINNGIHPGEPEGIDASIEFAWNILKNQDGLYSLLDNVVIAIIPVYNIGGALDRSPYYRMNQDGPLEKAGAGTQNMDLNRDFSKQETKNAISFARTFTWLNPDIFLDTHVTNGSDHQYILTLIPTFTARWIRDGSFFRDNMVPELYRRINNETDYRMIPYVMTFSRETSEAA